MKAKTSKKPAALTKAKASKKRKATPSKKSVAVVEVKQSYSVEELIHRLAAPTGSPALLAFCEAQEKSEVQISPTAELEKEFPGIRGLVLSVAQAAEDELGRVQKQLQLYVKAETSAGVSPAPLTKFDRNNPAHHAARRVHNSHMQLVYEQTAAESDKLLPSAIPVAPETPAPASAASSVPRVAAAGEL